MTADVTLKKATPYMLRYVWVINTGTNGELLQTVLMSDAVPGPLKAKLSKTYTTVEWAALNKDADLSVYVNFYNDNGAIIGNSSLNCRYSDSGSNRIALGSNSAATPVHKAVVEIRFNHSIGR